MSCGPWWCPWVPNTPFGVDFKAACTAHDACYLDRSKSRKSRKQCDEEFLAAMLKAVQEAGKGWYYRWVAHVYYRAVRILGWPSYHDWW